MPPHIQDGILERVLSAVVQTLPQDLPDISAWLFRLRFWQKECVLSCPLRRRRL